MPDALMLLVERNRSTAIRLGVVGALLGVLTLVCFLVTRVDPVFVLVAVVAPFVLLAMVWRLELSFAVMLLAAIFVRFRIPTGTASEIVISMVICMGCIGLWLVRALVVEKRSPLRPTPINLPLLAFVATVPISWVWGRAFRDPLVHEVGHPLVSVAAGMVMVLLPTCSLLVANNIGNTDWLQALVWVLLGAGLIVLVVDLGYYWDVGPILAFRSFLRTNGVIHVNSHGLLSMWCLALALSLALFDHRLPRAVRALLLVYVGAWVYWGFYIRISWLSGWVPLFVAAAVAVFFRSKRLFALLVVVMVFCVGGYYWRTAYEGEVQESGHTRLAAYEVNWRITRRHLLFGTGPAGYASYYMSYFPTEAMASHSNYIDLIAQTGIVGGFFYLWFFGTQAWSSYRLSAELRGRADFAESLAVAVAAGTAGCIVAMGLGDWLLPFAYTQSITGFDLAMLNWFFMGSLWALRGHLRDNAQVPDRHPGQEEAVFREDDTRWSVRNSTVLKV